MFSTTHTRIFGLLCGLSLSVCMISQTSAQAPVPAPTQQKERIHYQMVPTNYPQYVGDAPSPAFTPVTANMNDDSRFRKVVPAKADGNGKAPIVGAGFPGDGGEAEVVPVPTTSTIRPVYYQSYYSGNPYFFNQYNPYLFNQYSPYTIGGYYGGGYFGGGYFGAANYAGYRFNAPAYSPAAAYLYPSPYYYSLPYVPPVFPGSTPVILP